jgi:hypothetical protein
VNYVVNEVSFIAIQSRNRLSEFLKFGIYRKDMTTAVRHAEILKFGIYRKEMTTDSNPQRGLNLE